MIGLFIDTSTKLALIGLSSEGKPLRTLVLSHENQLSEMLVPSIRSLLQESSIPSSDLTYIAVGAGPGSYTGTRVGIAVAKSLSFALSIPLIRFFSPQAFAPQIEGSFAHLLVSKMQSAYLLKGQTISYEPLGEQLPLSSLENSLAHVAHIISDDRAILEKDLRFFPFEKWQWHSPLPNFDFLSFLTYDKFCKRDFESDSKLDVVYFHPLKF